MIANWTARRYLSLPRLVLLTAGLAAYGFSMAMMVRAGLGLDPWDVLHQGLAGRTTWSIGLASAAVGVVVLVCWLPLRTRPGVGTVTNVLVIAVSVDAGLAVLAAPGWLPARTALLLGGVLLNAVATVAYIGAGLGPGPRDGLMTGLAARTGFSVRWVRTGIETAVLSVGWLLGGTVGVGTVVYALGIGPLVALAVRLTPARWLAPGGYMDGWSFTSPATPPLTSTMGGCPTAQPVPAGPSTPTC